MKKYSFGSPEWKKDFEYVYSLVADSFNEFKDESDHVVNGYDESVKNYEYISIAHKDTFHTGARVSVKCSFDSYGAPLLTFANSAQTAENGKLQYGDHYEVVAYENGCNVWYITANDVPGERPFKVACCLRLRFNIDAGSVIELSAEVMDKMLRVTVNEASFDLPVPLLADKFRIGITACEGINRFYEATISQ